MWRAVALASILVLVLVTAAVASRPATDGTRTAIEQAVTRPAHPPIYFFSDVAAIIKAPGQRVETEVIRPSTIGLFADGSWYLEKLRWTGWGSKTAHAKGISNASNGIPSQAQGKRKKTPAQITLSHPGRFLGHRVYRCYQLTVQPPATDLHGCLTGHNGYWSLLP